MKKCFGLAGFLALFALLPVQAAGPARYFFANFEPSSGWKPGPLAQRKSNFVAPQGEARIARAVGENGLALELAPSSPFAAVMLDATPLAEQSVAYCETFARPAALGEATTEEFLDFGGAVLGFFRTGKEEGEICALLGKTEQESVWIASGMRFPLAEDGTAARWMRVTIRLNQKVGRWDLFLNGQRVLAGLRTVSRSRTLRLWLYGDASRAVQFDDVLVANRPPEEIEKEFPRERTESRHEKTPAAPRIGRQVVTERKANEYLRQASGPLQAARGEVRLKDWHLRLKSGDRVYEEPPTSDLKLIAYAPAYDDAGNPLPVTLSITADAALQPGADLADLRWTVAELLGLDADSRPKTGATIVEGDFRTGLEQTVTIPAEWSRKATSVWVWTAR